jgi:adenine-specific DNA methylase
MQQLILDLESDQKISTFIKPVRSRELFSIENRRFLGNKFKLLEFISTVIEENTNRVNSICDIFAGTGVVGHYLSTTNNKVIFNDILKSSTTPIKAFSVTTEFDQELVNKYIEEFNNLEPKEDNYFSVNFGEKYFTKDVARKIGKIRGLIEELISNGPERCGSNRKYSWSL